MEKIFKIIASLLFFIIAAMGINSCKKRSDVNTSNHSEGISKYDFVNETIENGISIREYKRSYSYSVDNGQIRSPVAIIIKSSDGHSNRLEEMLVRYVSDSDQGIIESITISIGNFSPDQEYSLSNPWPETSVGKVSGYTISTEKTITDQITLVEFGY